MRGTDGNQVCTTSTGILWHELGHQWRGDGPTVDPDTAERGAVEIENDLRSAQGLVLRDPDHWPESDCGCPGGCCIVASVATGSPFSQEVHALRRFRDTMLRGSVLGARFIDRLLSDYYAVSVPACRAMLRDPHLRLLIESLLVRPLVHAFGLMIAVETDPNPAETARRGLGADTLQAVFDDQLALYPRLDWRMLATGLEAIASGSELEFPPSAIEPFVAGIARDLQRYPTLKWAFVEPLAMYARARAGPATGNVDAATDYLDSIDNWVARVPLDMELHVLQPAELLRDLEQLASGAFVRPPVRRQFGERLIKGKIVELSSPSAPSLQRLGYIQ